MLTSQKGFPTTLDTPTPSFDQLDKPSPLAIMGLSNSILLPDLMGKEDYVEPQFNHLNQRQVDEERGCHRGGLTGNQKLVDPGEEIVRMACANNRKRTSISDQEVVNQLRLIMQITYNELKQASNDFSDSNILGNGGFASVYRGNWKGTDVAIKRLKCNLMDQALNELTILNSYRIDNILPIYGISIDGPEACLVYQFMSNGSLEDRLSCKNNSSPLSWLQRAVIGEGVAKGLYYLHTLRDKPLVHGDVKSANVLLDSTMEPKLGDFGLARQVFKGKQSELCTHCTVSSIHGTSVYLPPEYLRHKILSPGVDVYSYGIVLLEMATGKRAYDGKRLLIDLVEDETKSMSKGEISFSLKDSRLADDTQNELKIWFELLIKMGLQCAHRIKKKRLDMGQVLAKFAEFKQTNADQPTTSSNPMLNNNNNNRFLLNDPSINHNGGASLACTTERTLTPDLTAFGGTHQHPLHHINQQQADKTIRLNHSSLMVVEEEGAFSPNDGGDNLETLNDKRRMANGTDIEAMIPLITELGLVGQDNV